VALDGARLHVEVDGPTDAPALLLFSGARCTTGMWEPVLPGLVERFLVIRHDVRGTGRSWAAADAEFGLDRYADDAAAILEHLGVAGVMVWGMAFGARVALAFAARHPERVLALALFDASLEAPDTDAQRRGAQVAAKRRAELGLRDPERRPSWFEHEDEETLRKSLAAAYRDPDHRHYAQGVQVPVLIATGDHDPNLPASRRLQELIPGAELAVLEAVGHGSVLARPDLCLEVFLEFVERGGPPGDSEGGER
jgi:pimeloyl-ACP methyl ester carboxylesterase